MPDSPLPRATPRMPPALNGGIRWAWSIACPVVFRGIASTLEARPARLSWWSRPGPFCTRNAMASANDYPRDLAGYGRNPPDPRWPGGGRVALQFVLNFEEGGENAILHGDAASEAFLSDVLGAQPWRGQRHMNVESMYEYGSRAGFWRLWRMFMDRRLPLTVFGVATALARNPDAVAAMREAGWEIASHGLKWIDYRNVSEEQERAHLYEAIRIHTRVTGERPFGWYTGRTSEATLRLVMEEGG